MDISGTVAKMAMEYLKPEYPIYRIEYVKSAIKWDEEDDTSGLSTKKKSHLVEVKSGVIDEIIDESCLGTPAKNRDKQEAKDADDRHLFHQYFIDMMKKGTIDPRIVSLLKEYEGQVKYMHNGCPPTSVIILKFVQVA